MLPIPPNRLVIWGCRRGERDPVVVLGSPNPGEKGKHLLGSMRPGDVTRYEVNGFYACYCFFFYLFSFIVFLAAASWNGHG